MKRTVLTAVLAVLAAVPGTAQNRKIDYSPSGINYAEGRSWPLTLFGQSAVPVGPADLNNTDRIHSLMRGGRLYLSVNDAIALALENNLDIAIARENLPIADAEILRAKGGSATRGVPTGIVSGTPGGTGLTSTTAGAQGAGAGGTTSGAGGAGSGTGGLVTSTLGSGPSTPALDPFFSSTLSIGANTQPESSTFLTGTSQFVTHTGTANFSYNQGFLTGTTFQLGFQNNRQSSNSTRTAFNPTVNSGLQLTLTQHLLQGFGTGINNRQIRIAKNNREISDIAFRQQVMFTVSQIEDIYWDLVSAEEALKVAQRSLTVDNTILNNNQRQVQIGTLAPIEITRAQSQVAHDQQLLIQAQTQAAYQQLLLKNAVTKNMSDPLLAAAEVVPTDSIQVSVNEPVEPVQDLVKAALQYRPELAISRIQLTNDDISLKGIKNGLLPSLDLVASYGGNGLAGTRVPCVPNPSNPFDQCSQDVSAFTGGYARSFTHTIQGNFPNYSLGFNLQIPLRNRSAQADAIRSQIELRQSQLRLQQQENQIDIEVRNAQFTLQQNRGRVLAAQEALRLNRETLDAQQKKFNLGAATVTDVITAQRDVTQSDSDLVAALTAYQKSKVDLNRLTGRTLTNNRVSIIDAENGHVTQMPQAR